MPQMDEVYRNFGKILTFYNSFAKYFQLPKVTKRLPYHTPGISNQVKVFFWDVYKQLCVTDGHLC